MDPYAVLREPLPEGVPNRSVLVPEDTERFFAKLEAGEEPEQTVVFLNHYRPGEVYPNEKGTATLQLAVPASGRGYDLSDPFVRREARTAEEALALPRLLGADRPHVRKLLSISRSARPEGQQRTDDTVRGQATGGELL